VGAALYLGQGSVTATNCTFQGNIGGTVYAYYNSGIDLIDCIIRDTTGGLGVVAALENASSLDMDNCLVHDNDVTGDYVGGLVLANGASFNLTGCTFANNTTGGTNGSLFNDTWDVSTFTNCVIWGTSGAKAISRCGSVSCCLIFANEGGNESACFEPEADGNKSSNPGYCDPDNRDYRIASNSPCLPEFSGGCGLIGATDNGGCTLVAIEPLKFGSLKARYR